MCAISYMYGFPGGSVVRSCLPMQETQVQSLGQEGPLEMEMTAHTPLFLPGKTHGQRSLWGYNPRDHKKARHNLETRQQQQKNITCDTVYDRQVSINNGQINYGIWTSLKIISVNPKGNQP